MRGGAGAPGPAALHADHRCQRVDQDDSGVTLHFTQTSTGTALPPVRASVVIACDGVNSTARRQFYPGEKVAFAAINTWRGVTRHPPILTGKSYLRVGAIDTGKMVICPIVDNIDGEGMQLINWVAGIQRDNRPMNDWNKKASWPILWTSSRTGVSRGWTCPRPRKATQSHRSVQVFGLVCGDQQTRGI